MLFLPRLKYNEAVGRYDLDLDDFGSKASYAYLNLPITCKITLVDPWASEGSGPHAGTVQQAFAPSCIAMTAPDRCTGGVDHARSHPASHRTGRVG